MISSEKTLPNFSRGDLEIIASIDEFQRIRFQSIRTKDKVNEFAFSSIWIDNQPAKHIKGLKSKFIEILQKTDSVSFELFGEELSLTLNMPDKISIVIQGPENREVIIKASQNLTVLGLREIIMREWSLKDFEIRSQKGLLDDHYKLCQCNLEDNGKLIIEMKENPVLAIEKENRGAGSLEKCKSIPFANLEQPVLLSFNDRSPPWTTVVRGLNLEGQCQNKSCTAYQELVCIQKGMGVFHMSKECSESFCPQCQCKETLSRLSNVNNCILWDCLYSIEGRKKNGESVKKENIKAPEDRALSFELGTPDNPIGNIEEWKYLIITTKNVYNHDCILF